MTDSVGVIASASTLTVGTTTVYTVPTAKALIFKPQFIGQANAAGSTFGITINGALIFSSGAITGSYYFYSSTSQLFKAASGYPNGAAVADVVAPAVALSGFGGWYLSAGQVISYTVGSNALISLNFQVVGSLIDV